MADSHENKWLIFDAPPWKDWVFWVFVLPTVYAALIEIGAFLEGTSNSETLIVALFATLIINFLIYALIPTTIRSAMRRRRAKNH
jgi:uncharacterized Tic20 family protein